MAEEFVRKDVFDANMKRMDERFDSLEKRMDERFNGMQAIMEKTLFEIKADNEKLRSEIRVIGSRIDSVNSRIDSVQTTGYWGFALMGLILAFVTFAPSLLDFMKSFRRPFTTVEDVERMINAAIQQAHLESK